MRLRLLPLSAVLCVLGVALAPSLRAAPPQFWRIEGSSAFLEGDLTGLAVDSEGRVRLGAAPRQIYDPVAPNAWAVARDANGVVYIGTGNDGRVMRIAGGTGSLLFDSEELEVHALAIGPDGKVYAGTSPDGAVYAIDPTSGKATRFFDPQEKYIWALAFDAAGNLYVATGAEARVYRVDREGKATAILTSTDMHILSLAVDPRGRVFAGSAPEGIVYRVDTAGHVFVVLDSPFREIRVLDASEDGSIYVAAIDSRTAEPTPKAPAATAPGPATGAGVLPEVTVTESYSVVAPASGVPVTITPATEASTPAAPKGAVLRISDAGDVETLWTSADDVPHSLVRVADGVLVGTGDKGKLYRVTRNKRWTLVSTVAAEQVTALARGSGQDAIVVTSNPARVYLLDGTTAARGTFVSKVKDAETVSRWGQVRWEGNAPPGTSVQVQTRLGNTERPDATWTEWSAPGTKSSGEAIRSERARFIQVKATLVGANGASPTVEAVSASYLQRNLPPDVKSITVHPPGEVFQKPISMSGDPEILGLDTDPLSDRAAASRPGSSSPPAITFSRRMFQRGLRTISWQADDPNGDPLLYDVEYRAVGDERWRPLRRGLTEPVLAWDTSTVPNGRYLVRVVVSDAPGNPPSLALTSTKDSSSFEVDNTPPTIAASRESSHKDRIRATVRDDSPVRKLEFAVDAGRWEEVHPVDGIADSPEEQYEIVLPTISGPGPHIVMLRATDVLGNMSTVRVDVP